MVRFFYNAGILFYTIGIGFASLFNSKAKKRVKGYQETLGYLDSHPKKNKKRLWVHCASLGEFEQGRPLIEKFQNKNDWEVFVSFFSPSGYTIIKKKNIVENVFYLMPDTASNAKKTIAKLDPDIAVFVKYEFWANHIFQTKKKEVPLFCISGLFREGQPYFKYPFFKKIIDAFDFLFVQNDESQKLLEGIGISKVEVTGDTRFDRVMNGAQNSEKIVVVEQFLNGEKAFLVGSSWPDDEEHLFELINSEEFQQKCILAPHEIGEKHIVSIENGLKRKAIRFSELSNSDDQVDAQVLIIDNIGMLSNLYQYGSIAYVGGAFHGSLHNILEPAAFGLPVIFGPKFDKFPEGKIFIENGIGKSVSSSDQLISAYKDFSSNLGLSENVRTFVNENVGSTQKIMDHLNKHL